MRQPVQTELKGQSVTWLTLGVRAWGRMCSSKFSARDTEYVFLFFSMRIMEAFKNG